MEEEGWIAWITRKTNKIPDKEFAPSTLGYRRSLEYLRVPCLRLPYMWVLTARASRYTWRASAPQVEIQPEIRVKSRGREREKRRETRGKPVQQLAPAPIVQKAFYIFDQTWGSMGNTKLCSVSSPDSYQNQASLSAYLIVHTSLRWFTSSSG